MSVTKVPAAWPQGALNREAFCAKVFARGDELYRDLAWRNVSDPYAIWISEVMLQQTQVSRVEGRWQRWLARFPTYQALAKATTSAVLEEWQGMGYNRRALSLHRAAQALAERGSFPQEEAELRALPGVGPATAAGIRAFAFNLPGVYLETNVRTVFLHELFARRVDVPDRELVPLVRAACPQDPADVLRGPRSWYYALLDYGAYLKRTVPNPSRRSRTHTTQSRFEGSHRQKRAELLRIVLENPNGISVGEAADALNECEEKAGREPVAPSDVEALLKELTKEGFIINKAGIWRA